MSEAYSTEIALPHEHDARPLIAELRDLLVTRLGHAVHRMMEKVDDALFELAEKSENIANQSLYFDAMREVRLKRASIEESFRAHFRQAFATKVAAADPAPSRGNADDTSLSLAWGLVDDEAVEEQIAVHNLVDKVAHGCREEIYALDQRLQALLAPGAQGSYVSPVAPDVICESIRSALADLQSGLKVRLIILKLFDRYVAGELMIIYHECNEWMIGKGILPELRTQLRNPRSVRTLAAPGVASAAADGPPVDDASLVQALRALLLGETQPAGMAAIAGGGPVAHSGALHSLMSLQQGDGQAWGEAVTGQVAWAEGLRGEVNVLRSLKGTEITRAFGQAGDLTIDIVAMLFDYILDDRSIPSPLRALIGRLQIPIVKVALLDTGFFSRKSHPARRLLNTLAEAAASAAGVVDASDPLYVTMEQLVIRVNREFEQDIRIFAELLATFERFLVEEGERRRRRGERTRRVIGAHASDANPEEVVVRALDARLASTSLNDCVRGFIDGHWRAVLHSLALQHGVESDAFGEAVRTMDDLVTSVAPKHTPEERRRLSTMLPALLTRLKAGMERIELAPAARKGFLSELARVHSDAVRGRDTAGSGATATGPALAQAMGTSSIEIPAVASSPADASTVECPPPGIPAAEPAATSAAVSRASEGLRPSAAVTGPAPSSGAESRVPEGLRPSADAAEPAPSSGAESRASPEQLTASGAPVPALRSAPTHTGDIHPPVMAPDATVMAESDTVQRLHVPALAPVNQLMPSIAPDEAHQAVGPSPATGGTVTAFEVSPRQARRIATDLAHLPSGGEPAPVVPLRREPPGKASATPASPASELTNAIEVPAEIAERTSPREELADVLRSRLLEAGEVTLSELVDPTLIEERLARTLPLDRLSSTLPDSALERTLPVTPAPAGEAPQGATVKSREFSRDAMGQLTAVELMDLMESGSVAFEEVTLSEPHAPGIEGIAEDDAQARRVAALETGTWIEFTEEDGSRRQARLTWINSATDTFMFTDRRGLKVADRTRNGLIADFRRGSAQVVEQTGGFDLWMGRLMDGLGRAMQR